MFTSTHSYNMKYAASLLFIDLNIAKSISRIDLKIHIYMTLTLANKGFIVCINAIQFGGYTTGRA